MPPRPKHYAGVGLRNLSPTYNYTAPATSTAYAIATGSNRMTQSSMAGVTRSVTTNGVGDVTAFINTAGTANTLAYDPFGRLASHTKSGVTTSYTVNALDQRMAKANASSSSRYVYAGFNQLLAEQTNGQWSSYIYNGSEPVALVRNNQIYYLHNDHLGRPQLATNSSQQVVWKAANTAFDRTVTQDSIGGLSLGFLGQYLDAESGIWHNGYREYWAETGRYLQSDPIGLAGGVNTYGYTSGDPVSRVDASGLADCTYAIALHTLTCISESGDRYLLGPTGVFSGQEKWRNDPNSTDVYSLGPIPVGNYRMVNSDYAGGSFKLVPKSIWSRLMFLAGAGRGGFYLHKGTRSEGCITADKFNSSSLPQWNIIHGMLMKESSNSLEVVP